MPWVLLSVLGFRVGLADGSRRCSTAATPSHPNVLAGIGKLDLARAGAARTASIAPRRWRRWPRARIGPRGPRSAVYEFNWLSATGTGIFLAAMLSAVLAADFAAAHLPREFVETLGKMRWALLTIACMLALAFVTKYSGSDATLGLAFTHTGWLYPFFAPLLGWLGVALTGSDTSSNALFGSLQRITAEQLDLNPVLIVASNSTGGVMGKMIDAQSIVVAAVATEQTGGEGKILRFVLFHSIVLAALVGLLTLAQAYVMPWMIPG